jgi:hypothetical protein
VLGREDGGGCSVTWGGRKGSRSKSDRKAKWAVVLAGWEKQMNSKITAGLQGNTCQIELEHEGETKNTF